MKSVFVAFFISLSIVFPVAAQAPIQLKPPSKAATPKAMATKPSFEFRSHRIGDDLDSQFPEWRAKKEIFKPGCEQSGNQTDIIACDDPTIFEAQGWGLTATSRQVVGGVEVMSLKYKFFNGKLFSLDMALNFRQYSQIHDMLVGKYGKPTRIKAGTLQNRMGASFDNLTSEWDFKEGTLKFDMRFASVEMSWLTFENPAVLAQMRSGREAISQQKGKSAF